MPREANFACDECRERKLKCSKDRPSCVNCIQQGKKCQYSPKVNRTPLTRQNLTEAEDRIRRLEAAFAELLPNVDINSILDSHSHDESHAGQTVVTASTKQEPMASPKNTFVEDVASPGAEETLPQEADGFDWVEEIAISDISDGMAALSIKPEGTGYLGATSSVVPLRALLTGDLDVSRTAPGNLNPIHLQFSNPTSQLSGMSEDAFVDSYFLYYHKTYPFLHEETFRAQYADKSSRPRGNTWPILLNTVLALGAWSIGDENSTMDDVFYYKVKRLSQDTSVFEVGNLALVQALLLLSNYTQKRNKPNTGWNYLGLAIRMAMSLGLHKEFPDWKIGHLQREMRRRVWWGLYIFDSGASITFGRPVLLPESRIAEANQVLNIHEEALTQATTFLPPEIPSPTIYSSLRAQSSFHLATNPLYHRLISNPPPSPQELLDLEKTIDVWEISIPDYFQLDNPELYQQDEFILARYRLSWRAWNLRIILFRPTVLRWAARSWNTSYQNEEGDNNSLEEEQCRLLCLKSARETIASISEYMAGKTPSRLGSWYILYFLFQAGLIPIIFLITTPTSPNAFSWLDDLRITKDLISYVATSNPLAERCLEVIDRLCAPLLNATEPEAMLQDPGLFTNVQSMFVGDQGDNMEFLDWGNFGLQWGV
ncbi:Zn(II)2Cys6 transcription factor [Xylogone sp. PMI_703]|nr:Zn(II)2Cys6 transcription factor [Xylogone sp. PMI_703]